MSLCNLRVEAKRGPVLLDFRRQLYLVYKHVAARNTKEAQAEMERNLELWLLFLLSEDPDH